MYTKVDLGLTSHVLGRFRRKIYLFILSLCKKILIVKKYILVWCHFKALLKYYKFCSKRFSIRPSLGGENGVEGKNIQIYE